MAALIAGGAAVVLTLAGSPPARAAPAVSEAAAPPSEWAYVALGDSFTAAPLVPEPTGDPYDCGRSTQNYPHLVAEAIRPPAFRDVSCGSARTEHFWEPQTGLPLGGTNPPQFDALGPDATLVTIGIGGNDIGFGEVVQRCFQPPEQLSRPCSEEYTADGGDELRERIARTAPAIAAVVTEARRRAPAARVYVVGYPAILPHEGDGCYPYVPVHPTDVHYLRGVHHDLNAMLAEQAEANGATYVDWYTPSIGHDACEPPGTAWVNGMVIVPPSFPVHPNELGTAGGAVAVLAALEADADARPSQPPGDAAPPSTGDAGTTGTGELPATGGTTLPVAALALALAGLAARWAPATRPVWRPVRDRSARARARQP